MNYPLHLSNISLSIHPLKNDLTFEVKSHIKLDKIYIRTYAIFLWYGMFAQEIAELQEVGSHRATLSSEIP